MRDRVLVGEPLARKHPELIETLSKKFDLQVLSAMRLGESLQSLTGNRFYAAVFRIEFFGFATAFSSQLNPAGTYVEHCLAWDTVETHLSDHDLARFGLCGQLDLSRPTGEVGDVLLNHRSTCPRLHVESTRPSGENPSAAGQLTPLDHEIATLVARGFTDREIGEILHYAHQTIRNRVSHILRIYGLENRTELALQHLRGAIREIVETTLTTPDGTRQETIGQP